VDLGRVLLDLLVVLVVSRLAAEAAERIRQPAVLAEILLGVAIGPSALGLVHPGEAMRLLGEIGVILLLFEVGRQMDLRELARVGGASLRVAVIGVVLPMLLGYGAMRALGLGNTVSIFLAAGITATSVGIAARVFGDLRTLASVEARTVLGAAVADDVIGLLVLTVVVRIAGGGSVDVGAIAAVFGIAIGFVAVATILGSWIAPKLLDGVARRARTDGTVMALGLAVALGFARVASTAQLAPIVGAFVAGLAVGRSEAAEELHRKLTPLGHFFIPIFFLMIGIDTDLGAFGSATVLKFAAVLTVCGILGKIAAGAGVRRGKADRFLIGVGMIPRGEVGLIFASLGLSRGILDAKTYAVLLVVVLVTTVITPPWMRRRIEKTRRKSFARSSADIEPAGGWLATSEDGNEVELAAEPAPALAPRIALDAAVQCATKRPGPRLLEWLTQASDPVTWDASLRRAFFALLREGTERSWRFLDVTGMLGRLLPDLASAMQKRARDPFELDPAGALRWPVLDELKRFTGTDALARDVWARVEKKDLVLLAALLRDALDGGKNAPQTARRIVLQVGLDHDAVDFIGFLVAERKLLTAAAARPDAGAEEQVLDLAAYVADRDRADGLYLLALAGGGMETWERERLDALHGLVVETLAHPDLTGPSARDLVERRSTEVAAMLEHVAERTVRHLLLAAPRRYLLAQDPATIARHVRMIETKLGRFEARLEAEPIKGDGWTVHVAVPDARGVLATIAGALASQQVSVQGAQISTWRTGVAADVFRVNAPIGIDWERVRRAIEAMLAHGTGNGGPPAPIEGSVDVDNVASPWHTIVEIRARDRSGLLFRVASALSQAGLSIQQASIDTEGEMAVDTFWVTGRRGSKLDAGEERALREAFAGKTRRRWRAPWSDRDSKDRDRVTNP
jgi:Kef-type K+ transport system membrane component KefB